MKKKKKKKGKKRIFLKNAVLNIIRFLALYGKCNVVFQCSIFNFIKFVIADKISNSSGFY